MHAALLLALGLAGATGAPMLSPLESEPAFKALDPGLKPRARSGYLGLVGGLRPPTARSPRDAGSPHRTATRRHDGPAFTPAHDVPRPATAASAPPGPVRPATAALPDEPLAEVAGSGAARFRTRATTTWSPLAAGAPRRIPWGSWIATGRQARLTIELPAGRGRLDLAADTRLYLEPGLVRLQQGDVTVESGGPEEMQVATAKGRLLLGPGGRARVLPGSYRRLAGPVRRAPGST